MIESYGMPPLHCQAEQARFLNLVLSAMHREAGLRFPCPAVSCASTSYYFVHTPTNTVFVPLSESAFLLHMPDFYHELGHCLYARAEGGPESDPVAAGIREAVRRITEHYSRPADGRGIGDEPAPAMDRRAWAGQQWTDRWVDEAFCDLFALFAAGPAYAWSHLHLASKSARTIYQLEAGAGQDRPSDEARMRLLCSGMDMLGHADESRRVRRAWGAMTPAYGTPPPGHDEAFPPDLLAGIAGAVLPSLAEAGLRGYSGSAEAEGGGRPRVAALLNGAWRDFWDRGQSDFRRLEMDAISRLGRIAREEAAAPYS